MRIFISKACFSETFAFFKIGSDGMKAGSHLFSAFIIAAAFAALASAKDDEDEKFSKASCNFTLSILKHVATNYNSSNIIFSPASISILLSLLQQGARENTLVQLESLLRLSPEESRNGFSNLALLKEEKNVELEWGNRCYVRKGSALEDDFRKTAKDSFDVEVEELDFETLAPKDNADKINKWVRDVTHDRITNLIESSMLSPDMAMLLINAIFFKANWLRPFKKAKTAEGKFEITPESSVETLFMTQRGKFYADKDSDLGAKWIQLPFENNRFSMFFVLPTKRHRLGQLIGKMTDEDLHGIFSYRSVSQVKIRVPKFKLSEKVSLVDTLKSLGLTDVFSGSSDLRGMSSENFQVSEIIHEANVEIDEKGSTSSAATVIQFLRMGTPSLSFIADQPFLFFITDVGSNIPLFAGKVVNPKS